MLRYNILLVCVIIRGYEYVCPIAVRRLLRMKGIAVTRGPRADWELNMTQFNFYLNVVSVILFTFMFFV